MVRSKVAIAMMAGLGACSSVGFRGQQTPFGGAVTPTIQTSAPSAVAKSGTTRPADVRRVCRNSIESGWIAIDYLADSEGCGVGFKGSTKHPVALVADYRRAVVGTELEVCAQERIPLGWNFDSWVEDSDRCPNDVPSDKRTVKRIRKV